MTVWRRNVYENQSYKLRLTSERTERQTYQFRFKIFVCGYFHIVSYLNFIGKHCTMTFKCCVLGCQYEGKNGFHNFPSDQTVAAKWIEFAQVKDLETFMDRFKNKKLSHSFVLICQKHFKDIDYDTNINGCRRLKKGAIPSQHSPDILLAIAEEHDYSPIPRKRMTPRNALFNSIVEGTVFGKKHYNNVDGNNNPISFFADFLSSDEVGANTDVVMDEKLDTQSQECEKTTEEMGNDVDIVKITEELNVYKKRCEELSKIDEWTDDNVVKYLSKKFNKQQLEFFKMQIYNAGKKINGRRYSDDQKSLTLSMYKQSPKKYRFLRRFLILPGRSTLGRHRAYLMFQTGIDPKLMGMIKLKVKDMSEEDKLSMLCWDEVSLKAHIDYDKSRDIIDGFVDMNGIRRPDFATHALTMMVRGIQTPYKEPVSFNFTAGLKAIELSGLVRVTINAVIDTGLNLLGTVCDQPPTCVAAVHDLIEPGSEGVTSTGELLRYNVIDKNLVHVYDVPHIWKVLRNNLQVKDLCHTLAKRWELSDGKNFGQVKKHASWDHIVQLYNLDIQATQRNVPNLTPEHINPDNEKMKVSNATQIFSATVGDVMLRYSESKQLPADVDETALVLLFFNDLYDSLNGGGVPQCSSLKGSIDAESVHFAYWNYALSVIENMDFVDKSTRQINNRSTVLKKLESTIKGYMEITRMCLNSNIPEVAIRNTNQDGLENFFGSCKSLCGAKPIAIHYRSTYTTMIMNNLIGPVSKGANCEEDKFFALLSNINKMILEFDDDPLESDETDQINNDVTQIDIEKENERNMLDTIVFDPLFGETELNFVESESISNTSSAICRKLMEATTCDECLISLQEPLSHLSNNEQDIILPSKSFKNHFEKIFCAINIAIPHFCHEKSVKKKIITQIESIQEPLIGCEVHFDEMALKLKDLTANYALKAFCNTINNTLSRKIPEGTPVCNHIQEKAFEFRRKKSRIGKHSDKFAM